jgi:hypothetical protein
MRSATRNQLLGHGSTIERDHQRRHVQNPDDARTLRRAQRVEQPDHIGDALRGLHTHGPDEHGVALDQVDRCAQELGDDQAARQHEHQAAEQRLRQEAHHGSARTVTAST